MHERITGDFPDLLVHSIVNDAMLQVIKKHFASDVKATSAGEFSPIDGDAYGRSDTLNLASDPTDGATTEEDSQHDCR